MSGNEPALNGIDCAADPAVACSLNAGDQADRQRQWRQLGRQARTGHDVAPGRLRVDYSLDATGMSQLEQLIGAERDCCPFADFALTVSGRAASLLITGPEGTEEFFDFLHEPLER